MIGDIGGNMNKKGQALIEFVLILPVLLFILFAIIDFGIIFSSKCNLENDSVDIINLFKNGTSISSIEDIYDDISINVSTNDKYYKFSINSSVSLITPGLDRILGEPYLIKVERVIPYD